MKRGYLVVLVRLCDKIQFLMFLKAFDSGSMAPGAYLSMHLSETRAEVTL